MPENVAAAEGWADWLQGVGTAVGSLAGLSWLAKVYKERRLDNKDRRHHERSVDNSTRSEWSSQLEAMRAERDRASEKADEYEQKYQRERLEHVQTGFEVDKLRGDAKRNAERLEEKNAEIALLKKERDEIRARDAKALADVLSRRIEDRLGSSDE